MSHYENIPDELTHLEQWVCSRNDTKLPMRSFENKAASSTNPDTWSDYKTACQSVEDGNYDYIGFVFAGNGYVGIDIDAGFDEDGFVSSLASDIIRRCHSYTEISKSGRGFHIILKGNLPFLGKNNLRGVEIYKSSRYFIMTGNVFLDFRNINEDQDAINYIVETYFPETRDEAEKPRGNKIYHPEWEVPKSKKIKVRPKYPTIPDGSRNICLTSLAGMLHSQGYSKKQIYDELQYANKTACEPPLDNRELKAICNSVARYRK